MIWLFAAPGPITTGQPSEQPDQRRPDKAESFPHRTEDCVILPQMSPDWVYDRTPFVVIASAAARAATAAGDAF